MLDHFHNEKFIGELEQHYVGQEQLTQAQQERFQFIQIKKARVWYTQGKFKESKALLQSLEEELNQQSTPNVFLKTRIANLLEQIDYDFDGDKKNRIDILTPLLSGLEGQQVEVLSLENALLYLELTRKLAQAHVDVKQFEKGAEFLEQFKNVLKTNSHLTDKPDLIALNQYEIKVVQVIQLYRQTKYEEMSDLVETMTGSLDKEIEKYPSFERLKWLKYLFLKHSTFAYIVSDVDRSYSIRVAQETLDAIEALRRENPNNQIFVVNYIKSLNNLAVTLSKIGAIQDRFSMYQKVVESTSQLVETEPQNLNYRSMLQISKANLAETFDNLGEFQQAINIYKECIESIQFLQKQGYSDDRLMYAFFKAKRHPFQFLLKIGDYSVIERLSSDLPDAMTSDMKSENQWDIKTIRYSVAKRWRIALDINDCDEADRLRQLNEPYLQTVSNSGKAALIDIGRDAHYQCAQLSPSWTDGLELLNLRKEVYTKTPEIRQLHDFWSDKHITNAHILYYGYDKVALDVQTEVLRELEAIYVENPDYFTRRISYIEALLQYADVLYRNGQSVEALTQLDKLDLEIGKAFEVSPKFVKSKLLSVKGNILRAKIHQKRNRMDDALIAVNKAEMAMPEIYEGSPIAEHQFVHLQIQIVKGQVLFAKNGFDDLDAQNRILTSHTELTKLQSENKLFPPYNQLLVDTQFMLGQKQIPLDRLVLSEQELAAFAQMNLADVGAGETTESEASPIHIKVNPAKPKAESKTSNKVQFRLPK